jgi:glycosyltransferase involved in cell wall biosynthesis
MSTSITHFTTQLPGGSGIAAQRLHLALRRTGVESRICFGAGESADASMIPAFQNKTFFWRNVAALATSWQNRRTAPGGLVLGPGWIRKTPIQTFGQLPQIVNLHWVSRWLDLPSFFSSLSPELPVVWSIHDFIPVTGGCHYPGQCDGFTKGCGNCPQLKNPALRDDTFKFFRAKDRLYAGKNLHFVGNSEWTTAQIRRSGLAKHARSIRTIHLGLDTEQFKPVNKAIARQALKVPENRFVIGFACSDFNEHRKGAGILMEALKSFPAGEIILMVLGGGKWPQNITRVETIHMGSIGSPRLQSLFFSALDVFATPSLIETFGNTAMEAMACETPVVAYSAGGLADVVTSGETGLLEHEIGSVDGLVRMLQWMWKHPTERTAMGAAARRRVIENFSDALMARRYTELYHELVPSEKSFLVHSEAAN